MNDRAVLRFSVSALHGRAAAVGSLLLASAGITAMLMAGCAGAAQPARRQTAQHVTSVAQLDPNAPCDPTRDRAAILAMTGTFSVAFKFEETDALSPGYTPERPYLADATEVVIPLEVSDTRVVLQHVLLLPKHGQYQAQKHWRQDWSFEDTSLVEFQGRRIWQQRQLSTEAVRCTWSQAVFEVDDGPRYESVGRFVHSGQGDSARSEWTSQSTWRPLPRREYTHRDDYDVLVGTNKHVITRSGWLHEQDNVKLVLDGERELVRERGLNQYRRVEREEAQVARSYLEHTADFWADVRAEWQAILESSSRLLVHQELSGKPLYETLFPMADVKSGPARDVQRAEIHAAIGSYVEPQPSEPQAERVHVRPGVNQQAKLAPSH